jgi:Zn-dependent peptidase ImmA (M78 family)
MLRLKEIESIADQLLVNNNTNEPFVPIDNIAKSLDVNVLLYDFGDDILGILVININKGTIGFNPDHSRKRQRFSIAHELGHDNLSQHTSDVSERFEGCSELQRLRRHPINGVDYLLKEHIGAAINHEM